MNKIVLFLLGSIPACAALNAAAAETGLEGFNGMVVSNITVQHSSKNMMRGMKAPTKINGAPTFNPVVTDQAGRLQNAFILNYTKNNWTASLDYLDLRAVGDAYSLTNPFSFGVDTFESTNFPESMNTVNSLSGIYELNLSYNIKNNAFIIGKIDTSLYYLADPVFAGDLTNGADYAHAATRVVAPPFPSIAAVAKHDFGDTGWSITAIAGDAFGDRETLSAGKNISNGDLSYVLETNYKSPTTHLQLTLNHTDAFENMDKDVTAIGHKNAAVNAIIATASHWITDDIALFGRAGYSSGDAQQEDLNILSGAKYKMGQWALMTSQSATRVALDTAGTGSKQGDYTFISEATLNYNFNPVTSVGITYDHYATSGDTLLAKDGGVDGSSSNDVVGLRFTHFYMF